jgi:hypothetical protein
MPRPDGPKLMKKGKYIAFAILGVPPNMRKPKYNKKNAEINARLDYQDTDRVK